MRRAAPPASPRQFWPRGPHRPAGFVAGISLALVTALLLASSSPVSSIGSSGAQGSVAERALQAAIGAIGQRGSPLGSLPAECLPSGPGSAQCGVSQPSVTPLSESTDWLDLSGYGSTAPAPRASAMMCYDPTDGYVVLFGGDNRTTAAFNDTWVFAGGLWTELHPAVTPPARAIGGMTWDSADGYVLLFGGSGSVSSSSTGLLNDTWSFLHGTWTNLTASAGTAPSPRWRFAMSDDPTDGYVVLFGGTAQGPRGTEILNDTWTFQSGSWTNVSLSVGGSPPGRYRATMGTDAVDGYLVLFGGCTGVSCPDNSTWTYHALNWAQLSGGPSPSPRLYTAVSEDPRNPSLVLFGGANSVSFGFGTTSMSDTWSFAGGNWTNLTGTLAVTPPARGFEALAFDARDGYLVMFGGEDPASGSYLADTWALGPGILANLTVTPSILDSKQNLTLNVTAYSNFGPLAYSFTNLPTGCSSSNTSSLTCVPTQAGRFQPTVAVSDPVGDQESVSVSLLIHHDPVVLNFSASPDSVASNATTEFFTDVGQGTPPYSFEYAGLPPGCGSQNSSTLSCTPNGSAKGAYSIHVSATDSLGWRTGATTSLEVNVPPDITAFALSPTADDVGLPFQLQTTVAGGTAPFTFVYSQLPIGCLSENTSYFSCTPTGASSGNAEVQVTDSEGLNASASAPYQVNSAPNIETFAATPARFDLGMSLNLSEEATGGTGALIYAYSGLPLGCASVNAPELLCLPNETGTFSIGTSVTDSLGAVATGGISVVIHPLPLLTGLGAVRNVTDVGAPVAVTTAQSGGTPPFAFNWTGLPSSCAANASAELNCTWFAPGVFTLNLTVTDSVGATTNGTWTITVHRDPSITSFTTTPVSVVIGANSTIVLKITGGTSPYRIAFSDLPPGCLPRNTTRFICAPQAAGVYSIHALVNDSVGVVARQSATLYVTSGGTGNSSTTPGNPWILYAWVAGLIAVAAVASALWYTHRQRRPSEEPPAEEESPPEPPPGATEEWSEELSEP